MRFCLRPSLLVCLGTVVKLSSRTARTAAIGYRPCEHVVCLHCWQHTRQQATWARLHETASGKTYSQARNVPAIVPLHGVLKRYCGYYSESCLHVACGAVSRACEFLHDKVSTRAAPSVGTRRASIPSAPRRSPSGDVYYDLLLETPHSSSILSPTPPASPPPPGHPLPSPAYA